MPYREIIAVCSEIHTKHMNTPCGQNVELLTVKLAVHKINHCVVRKRLSKSTTSFIAVSAGNFDSYCSMSVKPVFGRTTFHPLCYRPFS